MHPSELIYKLRQLPGDTPITAEQLIAAMESLKPFFDKSAVVQEAPTKDTQLVDEKEVARIMGRSVKTLQWWRQMEMGPPFIKQENNGTVRYNLKDVQTYIEKHTVENTKQGKKVKRFACMIDPIIVHIPVLLYGEEQVEFFSALNRPNPPDGFLLRDSVFYDEDDEFIHALHHPTELQSLDIPTDLVTGFNVAQWFRDRTWDATITPEQLPELAKSFDWLKDHGNDLNATTLQTDTFALDIGTQERTYCLADVISGLGHKVDGTDELQSYYSFIGHTLDLGVRFNHADGPCLDYLKRRDLRDRLAQDLLTDDDEPQQKNTL
ncbi:AlpA family transcriptional regulator [Paraburkholderia fungorum]|jgi:hypothetical protein|uniref:helix-turn-helix transcriptional regulator n=1 Tax=Paraburkholderia fungorum TaxID=134537 RepID=UPI000D05A2F3|nr:helix-turn-helix domain-containing protein [Paraburkholderia fungorum]PRZ48159.1 hypothetical protein BX589_128115 [Paraburkholderia fungorum]